MDDDDDDDACPKQLVKLPSQQFFDDIFFKIWQIRFLPSTYSSSNAPA